MKNRMLVLSAFTLVAAAATAGAQGRGGGRGPGGRCAATPDSLTDAQKGQVMVLTQAFAKAHATQLDSLRVLMDASRAAREAGKSQDEIRAIMESGRPISESLAPDRKATTEQIVKLLTPAQIASGCIPPVPGGGGGPGGPGGPGGRRGGPPPGAPPVG